ncbi:MAG TPA: aminotransferase class V-fold PLP-dependent enzyme [Melioribacteraceae bacterium]|nr:aminotransferase class V-fold PLP-dependent enzyme [Melioribacteraceae bacterium]
MTSRREFLNKFLLTTGAAFVVLKTDAIARAAEAVEKYATDLTPKELASDDAFWGRIQSAFDVDRTLINLNNGGVSPSPKVVIDAFKRYTDYSNQAPAYFMWRHVEPQVETVREKLAIAFGADKEEIAITRNASESLQIVQQGMNLKEGDEVLTTTQDYPRMITTYTQLERRWGVKLVQVPYPTPLINREDYVNAFKKGITSKTKAILVSHICFLTGQILPILEVSRLAHQYGIPVICDAAHSFNHIPYKLKDLECDFFGTSLHKWTYAPVGTGMLYVKKDLIKTIWPLMAAPKEMDENIRKFEEIGTHPAATHNAIGEALAFNEAIGIERKAERFRYLHSRWINRVKDFSNVKFRLNINDASSWCGLVNFYIDGVDVGKLVDYLLAKHRIYVVPIVHPEFKGIRVTPNVYTLVSEIDLFGDIIVSVAKGEVKEVMETN